MCLQSSVLFSRVRQDRWCLWQSLNLCKKHLGLEDERGKSARLREYFINFPFSQPCFQSKPVPYHFLASTSAPYFIFFVSFKTKYNDFLVHFMVTCVLINIHMTLWRVEKGDPIASLYIWNLGTSMIERKWIVVLRGEQPWWPFLLSTSILPNLYRLQNFNGSYVLWQTTNIWLWLKQVIRIFSN